MRHDEWTLEMSSVRWDKTSGADTVMRNSEERLMIGQTTSRQDKVMMGWRQRDKDKEKRDDASVYACMLTPSSRDIN